MTPLISTRLAALSPRPDNASIAGSRSAPTEYSLCPSLFGPPLGGPPSFLDSKPSDPMTPDPTQNTRPSMPIHDAATRIFRTEDNTLASDAHIKNKIVANYKQPCVVANQLDISFRRTAPGFPDIVPDHQISDFILFGGFVVDDHQSGAAIFGQHWKSGGRPDHQRRPDRNKQVAMLGKLGGAAHRVFRHRLTERDGGGLHRLVADGAVGCTACCVEALPDPRKIVSMSAANAAGVGRIAVQLDDVFDREARYLMQIVDVLGDDGGNLAGLVERGQRAVTAPRLCCGKGRLHRKAPPPCLVAGILAGDEFIKRNRAVAGPQSAGRAEIGNSAFGRNTCAGEGKDGGGLGDHVAELLHPAAKIRCDHWNYPNVWPRSL